MADASPIEQVRHVARVLGSLSRNVSTRSLKDWERRRDSLTSWLFQTCIALQTSLNRRFGKFAMTAQEASVLLRCVEAREIRPGQVSVVIGRDNAVITRIVDRLEIAGFLRCEKDQRDRRASIIRATSKGRRIAPELASAFDDIREQLFAGIGETDLRRLGKILAQLRRNALRLGLNKQHSGAEKTASSHQAKLTALLVCILLLSPMVKGTSVAALLESKNRRIVIAADCRVNRMSDSLSECKIIAEPGCTAAIAGLFREDGAAFHLRTLATEACHFPGTLHDKAEVFLRAAKTPYERAVRRIRDLDPADFRNTVANKPTEVIFAGIENGHLALYVRGLIADSTGRVTLERHEASEGTASSMGFFAGLNLEIRKYVETHGNWAREEYLSIARKFVEMEIQANPDLAGPPISEIEIDDRGVVHWISGGACVVRDTD